MTYYHPYSPIAIRDGTYERLKTIPEFKGVYKALIEPLKEQYDFPAAVVIHGGERVSPMAEGNCGPPSFDHYFTLEVGILTVAGNGDAADTSLCELAAKVHETLLTDPTWVQLFEGIERFETKPINYPNESEFFQAQVLIEIEVMYRSIWEPKVPHDFRSVSVKTKQGTQSFDNPIMTKFGIPE